MFFKNGIEAMVFLIDHKFASSIPSVLQHLLYYQEINDTLDFEDCYIIVKDLERLLLQMNKHHKKILVFLGLGDIEACGSYTQHSMHTKNDNETIREIYTAIARFERLLKAHDYLGNSGGIKLTRTTANKLKERISKCF